MSSHALIYGTLAIDTLITPAGKAHAIMGGSGIYAALAARLLTSDMQLIGVVGDDFPPEWGMAMEARGISMEHIAHVPGKTFSWTGKYEKDMNLRTSLQTIEGVQENWQPILTPQQQACGIAVATNVTPPLQYRMLEQCPNARFKMADFMESWIVREPDYVRKVLSTVHLALMNDSEACTFAQTDSPLEAGYLLLEAGPRYAVIKHGSAGSTLFHRDGHGGVKLFRVPAWPLIHPKDPTGAGDAYMGALAGFLTHCLQNGDPSWEDMKEGIGIATVVAAATCEKFGAISLFSLSPSELARRIAAFKEMTHWA